MALGRYRVEIDKKLEALGIKMKYRLWQTSSSESWSSESRHIIGINPADVRSKWLAVQTIRHIILHEIGHLFMHDHRRAILKDAWARKLFRDLSVHYRRDMGRKLHSPSYISTYAQVHPADDFAETFAVYVDLGGDAKELARFMRRRKKSRWVEAKFWWLGRFIRSNSRRRRVAKRRRTK